MGRRRAKPFDVTEPARSRPPGRSAEDDLAQKIGPPASPPGRPTRCARSCRRSPSAMDARHCARLEMAELMAMPPASGKQRGRRAAKHDAGFVATPPDATCALFRPSEASAPWFGATAMSAMRPRCGGGDSTTSAGTKNLRCWRLFRAGGERQPGGRRRVFPGPAADAAAPHRDTRRAALTLEARPPTRQCRLETHVPRGDRGHRTTELAAT